MYVPMDSKGIYRWEHSSGHCQDTWYLESFFAMNANTESNQCCLLILMAVCAISYFWSISILLPLNGIYILVCLLNRCSGQVGDYVEKNGSYKMASAKFKQELLKRKIERAMSPNIFPFEIMLIRNNTWGLICWQRYKQESYMCKGVVPVQS